MSSFDIHGRDSMLSLSPSLSLLIPQSRALSLSCGIPLFSPASSPPYIHAAFTTTESILSFFHSGCWLISSAFVCWEKGKEFLDLKRNQDTTVFELFLNECVL